LQQIFVFADNCYRPIVVIREKRKKSDIPVHVSQNLKQTIIKTATH